MTGLQDTESIAPSPRFMSQCQNGRKTLRIGSFDMPLIGSAIATRAIMADLRGSGEAAGGPAPCAKADGSRFLQALDEALMRLGKA